MWCNCNTIAAPVGQSLTWSKSVVAFIHLRRDLRKQLVYNTIVVAETSQWSCMLLFAMSFLADLAMKWESFIYVRVANVVVCVQHSWSQDLCQ